MGLSIEMLDARLLMSDSAFFRTEAVLENKFAEVVEAGSGFVAVVESTASRQAQNLVSLSADGQKLWEVPTSTWGNNIAVGTNGDIWCVGRANGSLDPLVVSRFDASGNRLLETELLEGWGWVSDIDVLPDGSAVLVFSVSHATGDPGVATLSTGETVTDSALVLVSEAGVPDVLRHTESAPYGELEVAPDGSIIASAARYLQPAQSADIGPGSYIGILEALNAEGNTLWSREYEGSFTDMEVDERGMIYVGSWAKVSKLDEQGQVEWSRQTQWQQPITLDVSRSGMLTIALSPNAIYDGIAADQRDVAPLMPVAAYIGLNSEGEQQWQIEASHYYDQIFATDAGQVVTFGGRWYPGDAGEYMDISQVPAAGEVLTVHTDEFDNTVRVSEADGNLKVQADGELLQLPAGRAVGVAAWLGAGDDVFSSSVHLSCSVFGGAGNDFIFTAGGDDFVRGGAGNDWLDGYDGNDTILALDGDDVVYGRAGNDQIGGGAGADTLYGNRGDDVLSADEGEGQVVRGGLGNDFITAAAGESSLYGGAGDDTIYSSPSPGSLLDGGPGTDALHPGSLNDVLQDVVT